MDNQSVCQLCLQLFTDNTTSCYDDYINKLLKIFSVNKNLDAILNPVICQMCLKNLNSAYKFTLSANENNLKMLDATLEYDDEVCQTCLSPVQNPHVYLYDHPENIAPYSAIQKMLKYCLINLDLIYRQYPIMCDVCWDILKSSYRFLVRCEQSEKKVLQFCKEHNIAVVERRHLRELSEFCVGTLVEQGLYKVSDVNKTDSRNKVNAACSRASPDHIFSEIKIELEETAISRGIKTENVNEEADDSFCEVPQSYESCNTLFSNIANIKSEDICSSSVIEQSTGVASISDISLPVCDNTKLCIASTSGNKVRKDLYVKIERLELRQIRKKVKRSRTAEEIDTRLKFKCDQCPYSFKKRYAYIRHVATHMTLEECAKNNMLYHCDSCSYKSKHKYALTMHLKRIHGKTTCVNSKINTSKMKKVKSSLVIPKSDKYTFKCSHCEFETKVYARLETHAVAHKNTQTKKLYKCEVCGYQAKKKSSITRHVVTHSTFRELSVHNKLYKCDVCDYLTKRKDCLVLHASNVHGKVKKKRPKMKHQ